MVSIRYFFGWWGGLSMSLLACGVFEAMAGGLRAGWNTSWPLSMWHT